MSKNTRLTQQDLQIYPSQRMTDTPDGGGRMVGQPLKGEDNEIFPIVSDVDRTMGSFDARLLYPAVLRDDKEPLYGGHFIISEPPKADNVSYLAFKARNYGETRQDISTISNSGVSAHSRRVSRVARGSHTQSPANVTGRPFCFIPCWMTRPPDKVRCGSAWAVFVQSNSSVQRISCGRVISARLSLRRSRQSWSLMMRCIG